MVAMPEILALERLKQKDCSKLKVTECYYSSRTQNQSQLLGTSCLMYIAAEGKAKKAELDGTMSGLSQERLGNLLHWSLE